MELLLEFEPTIITKEEINRLEKSGYKFVRLAGARHKILRCLNVTIPINFILGAGRRLVGSCYSLL